MPLVGRIVQDDIGTATEAGEDLRTHRDGEASNHAIGVADGFRLVSQQVVSGFCDSPFRIDLEGNASLPVRIKVSGVALGITDRNDIAERVVGRLRPGCIAIDRCGFSSQQVELLVGQPDRGTVGCFGNSALIPLCIVGIEGLSGIRGAIGPGFGNEAAGAIVGSMRRCRQRRSIGNCNVDGVAQRIIAITSHDARGAATGEEAASTIVGIADMAIATERIVVGNRCGCVPLIGPAVITAGPDDCRGVAYLGLFAAIRQPTGFGDVPLSVNVPYLSMRGIVGKPFLIAAGIAVADGIADSVIIPRLRSCQRTAQRIGTF